MIFVIRDFSKAVTPLDKLKNLLMTDLYEIWRDIKKPSDFRDYQLTDFFNFVIYGMPSKLLDREAYELAVEELRKRWNTEIRPESYSRKVPADGFSIYTKQVWNAIVESSELNIPSQKALVASYR